MSDGVQESLAKESRVILEQNASGRVRLRHVGGADDREGTANDAGGDDGWRGSAAQVRELERDALLAGIALGQMQRYLELCEQSQLKVEIYRDDARARFTSDATGADTVQVHLRPRMRFACVDAPPERATAIRLLNEAASGALWYDAPRVQVRLDPVIEFAEQS